MAKPHNDRLWALAHNERANLAEDVSDLSAAQWRNDTLCGQWRVEDVIAHLTAAASINQWQWIRSMLGRASGQTSTTSAGWTKHRASTSSETLDRFRAVIMSTVAPSGHLAAYLGEVIVHAQDIRYPLGLSRAPSVDALTLVAHFFARRDFTVASRTHTAGLRLRADDGPFATGAGPMVAGSTLALVMSMAGRTPYLDQLSGPGLSTLRTRLYSQRTTNHR